VRSDDGACNEFGCCNKLRRIPSRCSGQYGQKDTLAWVQPSCTPSAARRAKKQGCKIANSEHYPSNRLVVDASLWFEDFKLRRADDDATPDAVRKSFNRARDWLQANDYIRENENKIWFIDTTDGQDK